LISRHQNQEIAGSIKSSKPLRGGSGLPIQRALVGKGQERVPVKFYFSRRIFLVFQLLPWKDKDRGYNHPLEPKPDNSHPLVPLLWLLEHQV